MSERDDTLLAQIEADVLDESRPVTAALRKCVILGGVAKSQKLRAWATKELQGCGNDDELPSYRIVAGVPHVDAVTGNAHVTGQQMSIYDLPEKWRNGFANGVELRQPLAEIEAMATGAQDGTLRITFTNAAVASREMDRNSGNPYQHIMALYFNVSTSGIAAVADQVRTKVAQLVGELRANMPPGAEVPSTAATKQAVQVAIAGEHHTVVLTPRRLVTQAMRSPRSVKRCSGLGAARSAQQSLASPAWSVPSPP